MAYCTKCGKQNPDTAKFCTGCGSGVATKIESTELPANNSKRVIQHKKKVNLLLIGSLTLMAVVGVYFIFYNKKNNQSVDKNAVNTGQVVPSLTTDTTIVTPGNLSRIGMIQFKNLTDEIISLALSYPVDAPDDWRTFGWREIKPGESFYYQSECASPELYYFAKTNMSNKVWEGIDRIYVLPIDNDKKSFEYHTPVDPKNYEKRPFVSISYFNNNNWPLQVILD